MSDEGSIGGDIFTVSATGGDARNATPAIAASPSWLYWESPNKILFTENVDGQDGISRVDLPSGKVSAAWTGPDVISTEAEGGPTVSLTADRQSSAVIRNSSTHPPEIWAGPIGEWKQITRVNDGIRPAWGPLKSLHWSNGDMKIQGWLMYPTDYDPNKRYPMVVVVHGGPAGEAHVGWPEAFFNTYDLSAHGYFVLFPNPRGSFGQGEKFTAANVKDFGYGDFQDILKGVDEVVKTLPVDNNRVGITGWSYGGYMTMWAVTQTNRFRAAVAGAGLANWQSYYGQNDIDEWMPPYFGATVYDDPAIYAKSAPDYIHKKCEDTHPRAGWPVRWRMPDAAIPRVLVGAENVRRGNAAGHLSRRRTRVPPSRTPARCPRSPDGMVRPLFEINKWRTGVPVRAERSSAESTTAV